MAEPRLGPTTDPEDLIAFHGRMVDARASLGYGVDGVVYKLNDLAMQASGWIAGNCSFRLLL